MVVAAKMNNLDIVFPFSTYITRIHLYETLAPSLLDIPSSKLNIVHFRSK